MTAAEFEIRQFARQLKACSVIGSAKACIEMAEDAGTRFAGMDSLKQFVAEYEELVAEQKGGVQ